MLRIRKARLKAGYTVQYVAMYCGVSRVAVYQWESGVNVPRVAHLKRLANLYGCTVQDLLED